MRYGLIGKKLSHSFSKEIHNRIADYGYELKELNETELTDFLKLRDFSGINVTIPYKTEVVRHLDCIDDAAERIGAVNTVVNRGGKLYGYNTDAYGLSALIEKNGILLKDKKVLILGSGGTSKTAAYVAENMDAGCVIKVSRTQKNGCITYSDAVGHHADADVIINTTPCGMYPDTEGMPVDISAFGSLKAVVDVIYNPLKTRLLLAAQERGITAAGGLYMLLLQAVKASELFTGNTFDSKTVYGLYEKILNEKQNIVLIGMPSSGKTTVGRELSKVLGMQFSDSDDIITAKTGKTPAEIIKQSGEPFFRKIEREVISEISCRNHTVIATGGGTPTVSENITSLKANGKVYFIDRPCELLQTSGDRPLSSSKEAILSLYEKRIGIYRKAADVTVKNASDTEYVINEIRKDFCYENFSD